VSEFRGVAHFIRIYNNKTAANARRFLRDLERACPIRIRTILTDNGKEFTDRLFGLRKRVATGKHEFDLFCAELGIEHRLTPPRSPQTNGMVEWFPLQAMKDWHKLKPELFKKQPYYRPGCDR
jgi:transposase InsO family protein